MQSIGNWINRNESQNFDIYSNEGNYWEDELSVGHEALRNSETYKWLISTVRRKIHMSGIQPTNMEAHRQWLLKMLENVTRAQAPEHSRVSRHRRPVVYTVKFQLPWNLIGFLQNREYAGENLHRYIGRVITLSGDHQSVQALPCKEYMEQIWPSTGADFIRLLERAVETPAQPHERKLFSFVSESLSDRTCSEQ
jgi:hypothetical protein